MASTSVGNPQSNNLYAYTQNMPTDLVDPSGLNRQAPGGQNGILWTWMHFRDGVLIAWRQWFEAYPGQSGIGDDSQEAGALKQSSKISPDCIKALKKLGVLNQVEKLLTTAKYYDVDDLFDLQASDFVGKNSGFVFLGDWFNSREHKGRSATTMRGPGRREGIYYRSSIGISDDVRLHEVTHLAYPAKIPFGNTKSLDELLGVALGLSQRPRQDGSGNETWSQAVGRFFNAKCNPTQLK